MAEEASAAGRPFKMAQCFVADHRLLELKLTRKNSKIESLKEEVTNSRDKIEGQTQQLRQLESEKQKIQEENLILTAKNSAKEDKVSSLIDERVTLSEQKTLLEKELETAQAENAQIKKELTDSKIRSQAQKQKLNSDRQKLQEENLIIKKELEEKEEGMKATENQNAHLQASLRQLESEKKELSAENEKLRVENKNLRAAKNLTQEDRVSTPSAEIKSSQNEDQLLGAEKYDQAVQKLISHFSHLKQAVDEKINQFTDQGDAGETPAKSYSGQITQTGGKISEFKRRKLSITYQH